jgi:hypothetical protein
MAAEKAKVQKLIVSKIIVSVIGLGIVSGFGGLLGFYIPEYAAAGKGYTEIGYFLSLPNLTMYVSNVQWRRPLGDDQV